MPVGYAALPSRAWISTNGRGKWYLAQQLGFISRTYATFLPTLNINNDACDESCGDSASSAHFHHHQVLPLVPGRVCFVANQMATVFVPQALASDALATLYGLPDPYARHRRTAAVTRCLPTPPPPPDPAMTYGGTSLVYYHEQYQRDIRHFHDGLTLSAAAAADVHTCGAHLLYTARVTLHSLCHTGRDWMTHSVYDC